MHWCLVHSQCTTSSQFQIFPSPYSKSSSSLSSLSLFLPTPAPGNHSCVPFSMDLSALDLPCNASFSWHKKFQKCLLISSEIIVIDPLYVSKIYFYNNNRKNYFSKQKNQKSDIALHFQNILNGQLHVSSLVCCDVTCWISLSEAPLCIWEEMSMKQ